MKENKLYKRKDGKMPPLKMENDATIYDPEINVEYEAYRLRCIESRKVYTIERTLFDNHYIELTYQEEKEYLE